MVIEENLLKKHVKESNAIENIFVRTNHHLFVDHLEAAKFVLKTGSMSKIATPKNIHAVLMKRELCEAGKFRQDFVRVGLELKPPPDQVNRLMNQWMKSLQRENFRDSSLTPKNKEKIAWHYHNWFETIHPFIDGNGRTGRLILNNIRLLLGLPWLIVLFSKRWQYYDNIRKWETGHKKLLEI